MGFLDQHFSIDNDEAPAVWDQLSFWSAPFGKLLLDNMPMDRGLKVLDVGCGAGFPAIEFAQRLGSSSHLTGIDIWKQGIERAKWKAEWMGLKNISFEVGDCTQLPFENGSFNLVISNLGINNFEHPEKVLEECRRVLMPQGKLCLTTNLQGHFRAFYKAYEQVLKDQHLNDLISKLQEQEMHRGTDETIRDLIENAGFSIVKMIRDRHQMRFIDGSALLNHFLVIVGFLDGWRSILPKDIEVEVFNQLEVDLNKLAQWEGELKMTIPMLYVEALK